MAKDDFKVKKGLVVGKGIVADSDVRANAFIGDGSQLTNLDYNDITSNLPNILDSGNVSALIDSADTHDSAAVLGQITSTVDGDYVKARMLSADGGITDLKYSQYDHTASTITFDVTVGTKTSDHRYSGTGSGSAYFIEGDESPFIQHVPGNVYRFDGYGTSSGHPLKFYLEADRTTQYTTGVTEASTYTEISVTETTPTVLYYQCSLHAYMGNAVHTMTKSFYGDSDVSVLIDSALNVLDTHDSAAVLGQIAATLNDTVTITKNSTSDPALKLQTTADGSSAAPIMEFIRNTSQANNGDYLGQIKFRGEDSGGSATTDIYAKITGKISDATDGTEDGLIEFAVKSGGSNTILARMTGAGSNGRLDILNGADISVATGGDITVDGNSVLTTASDTHDSSAVQGQITNTVNLAYINSFSGGDFDSDLIPKLAASDITSGIFDSARIPQLSTNDVNEGTNLYYTTSRTQSDIGLGTNTVKFGNGLSYSSGNFSFDGPDSSDIRTVFSGGTGVSIDGTGSISVGQSVGTTDNVTFADVTASNLTVTGTTTSIDTIVYTTNDPLIHLADSNEQSDVVDIGFLGHYYRDGQRRHTGLFRDASNQEYYLYFNMKDSAFDSSVPPNVINRSATDFTLSTLNVGTLIGQYQGFDSDFNAKSTSNLSEGTNLYYTTARGDSDTRALVDSDYVRLRADSDYIKTVTGFPSANLNNSSVTVTAGNGLSNGGSVSLGGSVTISIDSANIQSFTLDSAEVINLIDSDYVRPLARAAIVAGANITYDSATGIISGSAAYGNDNVTALVNSDYVQSRADSDYIKTVTGIPITNLAASTFEVVAGKGLLNGGSASLGGTVTINIDSANIQGFTVDSAEVINLIDSDYVRPLARAAIVAGANITYDSATGVIASTGTGSNGAGATLAFSVSLYLLDSTSRAGTGITSPLGVGDPVFYDSDAGYWTGAKADSDLVASHVITNFSTSTATFEIAQTGIFNLDSNGSSPTFIKNSFYYLSDSAGVPTPTQPLTGVFQPLYYALDSNKIDINISDAVSIGLGTTDVEQFPAVTPGDSDLTLTQTINTDRTDVFKNGILLRQAVDYTIVSPSLIRATTAPQLGDIFSVRSTVTGATLNDTITGITAAAPSPAVAGDNNTGLFSSAADTVSITTGGSERLRATNSGVEVTGTLTTNAINGGPTIDSATISGDLTLTGGVGKPNNVSLSDAATINFNIDSGNTGTLTFGSSGNRTLVVGVTGGASMAPFIGTSFTILAFNNDISNDRTLTVQAAAGNTLHFGSSNVITVKSQKMSIISGMVFDADELVLSSVTLDSSVTF